MCHPSFEDHKYGRGSRPTRCLFSVPVNNASEVVRFSHPSIPPIILASLSSSLPQERAPWPFKQAINLIRSNQSATSQKTVFPLLQFVNLSISLPDTIPVSIFVHCLKGSQMEVMIRCRRTNTDSHDHRQTRTLSHTHARPNQASVACSLMFVKVINFLCEIRDHGGRTEGDGCQAQNHSLLSSADTGALWVRLTEAFTWAPGLPAHTHGSNQQRLRVGQMREDTDERKC